MAILFDPGLRLADSDGNPLSGAKVRVYTADTTTLVNLYSDQGLSTSIPNPVITNADGYPSSDGSNECAIYCAAGTYDVAFLAPDNSVLASWDDFSPGDEEGDFERTVSGLGRFKFTGSAGAVMLQVGDPSPDDNGGTFTIEGWAGTQLDNLTLDAAITDTTGRLRENGKKLIGVVQTPATTFSAATTVDIELTNTPTGCRAWEIDIFDLLTSNSTVQLRCRLSYDGGATFKSGASDYAYALTLYDAAANAFTASTSTGAAFFDISNPTILVAANNLGGARLQIITPTSGSASTLVRFMTETWNSDGFPVQDRGVAMGLGGYGRATHIRLLLNGGGTVTGKYLVKPLRGYGEA